MEVLRGLAAVGEAGRAVGVVLAPWEEQTSSLSQRTDSGDQNKVQSGSASFEDRPADCAVVPGSIGSIGSIGKDVEFGRVVQPPRPTCPGAIDRI